MKILAINFNHDGSGVILDHGIITAYVNTERFSQVKKQPGIREADLDELLDQSNITIRDIDYVILVNLGMKSPEIYDRYHRDFSNEVFDFTILDNGKVLIRGHEFPCHINPDHFLCHSSVAYYMSPFDQALCFSYDPLGSGLHIGKGNKLEIINHRSTYAGRLYNYVSLNQLKLGGIYGAGKTMALASFISEATRKQMQPFLNSLSSDKFEHEEQCEWLERYVANLSLEYAELYEERWNITAAYTVQALLEKELSAILNEIQTYVQSEGVAKNLCLSGGAALNTVANQRCFLQSDFDDLYIPPACGDDGTAIGAALYHWHHVLDNPKRQTPNKEAMYSVRHYNDVENILQQYKDILVINKTDDYIALAAQKIADGSIIAWFNGTSEIGPRALGNRSILCNPTSVKLRDELNSEIKKRESFRPFAPAVLEEFASSYFDVDYSPYMLRIANAKSNRIPGVTHIDNTARVQTVREIDNPNYYNLIKKVYEINGIPVVLNTSFNIDGDPIVETPEQAVNTFLNSQIEYLFFPGYCISKRNQEGSI